MGNILASLPLVDVLLRMELQPIERIVLMLQCGNEFLTEFVVIERHHAKFIRQIDAA